MNLSDDQCALVLKKISKQIPALRIRGSDNFIRMMDYTARGLIGSVSLPLSGSFLCEIIDTLVRKKVEVSDNIEETYTFFYHGDKIDVNVDPRFLLRSVHISEQDMEQKKIAITNITAKKSVDTAFCDDSLSCLQSEVVSGIKNNEFSLVYQPVHHLKDELLYGFEALIRWNRKGILISPEDFIPLVEKTDVVFSLNEFVIDRVLLDLEEWNKTFIHNDEPLRVNINLSARLFETPGIADLIIDKVSASNVDPQQLGLELTESAFMDSKEIANIALLKLKAGNFPIYMDDFGTGYSSLSYLQHFPVDILKIDKSFVKWVTFDDDSEHIVTSIIGLAHGLKMKVVAEGVEEKGQLNFLKDSGCEFGQGFFFSKPLGKSDAVNYLSQFYKKRKI